MQVAHKSENNIWSIFMIWFTQNQRWLSSQHLVIVLPVSCQICCFVHFHSNGLQLDKGSRLCSSYNWILGWSHWEPLLQLLLQQQFQGRVQGPAWTLQGPGSTQGCLVGRTTPCLPGYKVWVTDCQTKCQNLDEYIMGSRAGWWCYAPTCLDTR